MGKSCKKIFGWISKKKLRVKDIRNVENSSLEKFSCYLFLGLFYSPKKFLGRL